jgi:copper transport protein
VYSDTWKVVSSIDGHQTTGSFPFAVGDENAEAVSTIKQSSNFRLPFSTLLSKFLMLASLALLLGNRLFIALVWEPVVHAHHRDVVSPPVWDTFYRLGLLGMLIAIGVGMLAQGGQSSGSELAAPWNPELGRILTETRLGVIWLARLALIMLGVLLAGQEKSPLRDWTSFAVNLALLFTVTLTSHAATEPRPLLPILGDWLHLVGMAFWLGGLVYFFTAVRHLHRLDGELRTQLTSFLAGRFSVNAILVVALIGLTGVYSAYLRVGSWHGLVTSLYGHTLLVKQIFVAGLLAIAATNLMVISPQLKRDRLQGITNSNVATKFGKLLVFELIFAGLLLASVSFLTYIPPAKLAAPLSDLTDSTRVDDLEIEISISPGRIGQNTFVLQLSSNGEPLRNANEVLLRFTSERGNIAPSDLELIGQGDGTFSARGTYLSVPGAWQVQTIVRRENKFDAYANFDFSLQKSGTPGENAANVSKQTGVLILFSGLLCGLLAFAVEGKHAFRLGVGVPLTVLTIGLGVYYFSRSTPAGIEQANPVPPNTESVAAGRALFMENCALCHGDTGKGDGILGLTLNPRPADLTQHAIAGIHTDAQLFEWISNGFPGSSMPPFKASLSDTDRWHLVNFIRSLAPK